jgi:hypothetical protein
MRLCRTANSGRLLTAIWDQHIIFETLGDKLPTMGVATAPILNLWGMSLK